MKMNIFVTNDSEDLEECGLREYSGHRAVGLMDPDFEIVETVDEERLSEEKLLAKRFLTFLGNRRLTVEEAEQLPKEEQRRLRKEFLMSLE